MKNVIIIGGTDGIGRAFAEHLINSQQVLIVGRNEQKGKAFRTKYGANASFIAADVSLLKNVVRLVEQIRAKFERIDAIIHTADILTTKRTETAEGLEMSIAINYFSRVLFNYLMLNEAPGFRPEKIIHIAAAGFPPGNKFLEKFPPSPADSAFRSHGYGQMANDFYGLYMRDVFEQMGTQINILNPGMVDTNIRRKGQFPKIFRLLEPLMNLLLSPIIKTPEEYIQIPLAILNDESLAARQSVLINAKGKAIRGNKVLNNPEVQRYVYERTIQTLEELTGMKLANDKLLVN